MRIIAGKLKGFTLHLPSNKTTRPLKDRVRESIFNLLTHSNKISFQFENSNVLDLYAGTGSFGLECISRQVRSVCFVEKTKEKLEKNIPLNELTYWNVELQEAYFSPKEAQQRYEELNKK